MKENTNHSSLSEYITEARKDKGLSLEKLTQEAEIRRDNLLALVEGRFDDLPPDIYVRGYLRKIAQILGLDGELLWDIYTKEKKRLIVSGAHDILPRNRFTKKGFFGKLSFAEFLLLGLIFILAFAYIGREAKIFLAPPTLDLSSPAFDLVTQETELVVRGQTNASQLQINNQSIFLEKDGSFRFDFSLISGLNIIKVEARNRLGRTSLIERRVILE